MDKTYSFPIIDMHIHLGRLSLGENYLQAYDTLVQKELLETSGISKAVALDLTWGDEYLRLKEKLAPAGDFFELFPSVDYHRVEEPDFEGMVYRTLRDYKSDGVKGLKLWKDITLTLRDKNDKVIPVDSPLFDSIWAYSAEFSLPIVNHIGAQPAFFDPVTSDHVFYDMLQEHPEWSFDKPGMPSFKEHMDMQERLFARHPKTQFVVAHVSGYVDDLEKVSEWLERFPNVVVDISARVGQLARQSDKARDFILKYPDRVLFGTDYGATDKGVPEFYQKYFQFLESRDLLENPFDDTKEELRGVGLPLEVLEKVYYSNAKRILKLDI